MITLDGFQMRKATDREPLLVAFSLVDHRVNVLGEDFSSLQANRAVRIPHLLVNAKRALNGGGGTNVLDGVAHRSSPSVQQVNPRLFSIISDSKIGSQRVQQRAAVDGPFRLCALSRTSDIIALTTLPTDRRCAMARLFNLQLLVNPLPSRDHLDW
jgi:hypothetical protein